MNLDKIIAVRTSKTIYRDGDSVIKVFDGGYSKVDILNEALNQARVENIGLSVPKIKEVTSIDGKWAIVAEYIPGRTLASLMEEQPERRDELLEMFVDLQLEVHSKRAPLLTNLRDKMNGKIDKTDFDASTRYELKMRLAGMPKHNKVCHGDFNPSNIIMNDGKAYIIDWAHVTQGNASADAARTYLLFWLAGDIDGAEKYMRLFCKKSDTARQYIQQWMPIVAASQTVKGNAAEREFLHSWVNVVEYE